MRAYKLLKRKAIEIDPESWVEATTTICGTQDGENRKTKEKENMSIFSSAISRDKTGTSLVLSSQTTRREETRWALTVLISNLT